jgi:hypothetical protein
MKQNVPIGRIIITDDLCKLAFLRPTWVRFIRFQFNFVTVQPFIVEIGFCYFCKFHSLKLYFYIVFLNNDDRNVAKIAKQIIQMSMFYWISYFETQHCQISIFSFLTFVSFWVIASWIGLRVTTPIFRLTIGDIFRLTKVVYVEILTPNISLFAILVIVSLQCIVHRFWSRIKWIRSIAMTVW